MTPITFWFDPISPYAYLAFERLPEALEGCSYAVSYRPVLFAGLLAHWGQLGPAEIAPKRDWTYRQALWLGHRQGTALQLPAAHPFNPLALLRLLMACGSEGMQPNRLQCERVLRYVWQGGAAVDDAARLAELSASLQPRGDQQSEPVKRALRDNTETAIAHGVFGVPTLELPGRRADDAPRIFWGADALDMVAASLRGDPWFESSWDGAAALPSAAQRRR